MKDFDKDYDEHKRNMVNGGSDYDKIMALSEKNRVLSNELSVSGDIIDRQERRLIDAKREIDFLKSNIEGFRS